MDLEGPELRIGHPLRLCLSHVCLDGRPLYTDDPSDAATRRHQFQVVFTNAAFKAKLTFETWIASLVAFHDELVKLNRDLSGKATLTTLECDLELEVTIDKLGHLTWDGVLRYPGGIPESTLEFTIEDDQTSLGGVLSQISAIIDEAASEHPQQATTGS